MTHVLIPLKNAGLFLNLVLLTIFALGNPASAETNKAVVTALPITLRVFNLDRKLEAVLLSGDFKNTLAKPIRAWRGELHLRDTQHDDNKPIVLFFEHQARRPMNPGEWGVWSYWLDIDPDVAEHQALQKVTADSVTIELQLLRVLYADGSQQAF